MEKFFPYLEGVDYSKLLLNNEGRYSITRRSESESIVDIMYSIVGNLENKVITDVTGCMGGDTINFSLHFEKVFSIEMNPKNFEILKNNVGVFGCKNVSIYCKDSTEVIDWVSDVVYADPPWGGPSYRTMQNVELWMGKKKLDVWLEDLMSGPYRPSFIFLKLPFNYNPIKLAFLPNFIRMQEVKIQNFFMICIEVKN
jgi:RNA cap guanine-N2 methyltransferase